MFTKPRVVGFGLFKFSGLDSSLEQYRGSARASEEKIKQWEQRSIDTGMERSEDSSILGIIEALKNRDQRLRDGDDDGNLYPLPITLSPMVRDEHDGVREEVGDKQQEDEDDDDYDDGLAGLSLSFASEETREFYRQLRRPTDNKPDESEGLDDLASKHIEVDADRSTDQQEKKEVMGGKEDGETQLSRDMSRTTDASSLHPRVDGSSNQLSLPLDQPKDISTSKGVSVDAGSLLDTSTSALPVRSLPLGHVMIVVL